MPDPATGSTLHSTTENRPGSLQEAQSALEKMMSREVVTPPTAKRTPSAPHQSDPANPSEADPTPDELEAIAAKIEAEDEPESEPEEPSTEEEDDPPTESTFTVIVDGKEEKVPASELIAGYQRNKSYTQKSMALAEDRKAFQSKAAKVEADLEEYAALIPRLRAALEVKEPDWAKIKAETPDQFATLHAEWRLQQDRVEQVKAEERRVNAERQAEFDEKREQLITSERNAFLQAEPSWRDPKVAAKDAADVATVLKSVGFSGDDLNIYDHRSLRLALMAARYMRGVKVKGQLVTQRAESAPVVTPGAGPAKKVVPGRTERAKFLKTGSVKDAAKMFESSGMFDD